MFAFIDESRAMTMTPASREAMNGRPAVSRTATNGDSARRGSVQSRTRTMIATEPM
ncbi:Uncharacterised protein [Mycobacteroides abscessus subsp. abscessus]|nr:Uncharacterised protein [Mycobacteroides abscessus subsp. abscessus]